MNFFGDPQAPELLPAEKQPEKQLEKPLGELGHPGPVTSSAVLVQSVSAEHWRELIAWIDPHKDEQQVASCLAEFQQRVQLHSHAPAPLEARVQTQRVAAAYMVLLGARVAALGGVRSVDNHTTTAAALLSELVAQVRAAGVVQIQAILNMTESITTEIVELAGFVPLAKLLQMTLLLPAKPSAADALPALPAEYQWLRAQEVSRPELVQLIAHTFIETLDCPELNGLRTPEDVLEGFLDGQTLESREHWWLIKHAERLVGCALVNPLPNRAAELAYMGLGPTSRGRGLGKHLLQRAIDCATQLQAEVFLAAVDSANWPASRLYFQAGFHETARVQAWFHRPSRNPSSPAKCFLC